jgi:[acyl-carrier-protein] S-malonyltransferase
MEAARVELEQAIVNTEFKTPVCPVYQNIDAKPYTDIEQIKHNLIAQLTGPVRWTQTVIHMLDDGATCLPRLARVKFYRALLKRLTEKYLQQVL